MGNARERIGLRRRRNRARSRRCGWHDHRGGELRCRQTHLIPGGLLKEGFTGFLDDNALTRGAAIAFYAVTAIAPVLFIATTVAGLFLGQDAASGAVRYQLRQLMSPQSADMVQFAILHVARRPSQHCWAA